MATQAAGPQKDRGPAREGSQSMSHEGERQRKVKIDFKYFSLRYWEVGVMPAESGRWWV